MKPTWLTAFIDLPPASYDVGVRFWEGVTGYAVSPSRGEQGEFATLVPPEGDAFLRVQRIVDGPAGVHLDVHRPGQPFEVRRSPGGLDYCEVSEPLSRRPPPATWPGGHWSIVDQVCLDIAAPAYERECAFWRDLTGLELQDSTYFEEFRTLARPADQPIRVLLQRVGDDRPGSPPTSTSPRATARPRPGGTRSSAPPCSAGTRTSPCSPTRPGRRTASRRAPP